MLVLDRDGVLARMQHEELLSRANCVRCAAVLRRRSLARRLAAPVGHALVRLGVRLLHDGQSEAAIVLECSQPPTPSVTLN